MKKSIINKLLPLLILTACGGGGGGGSSSGGGDGGYNPNNPPVIDGSTTSYSVIENQTSAFTVSASDADGDSLTYSISGGEDGSLFNISSSGIVTFITAPDFEFPTDANSDNSYALTVSVTDGTASASQNFSVTVTNDTSDDSTTFNFDGVLIRDGYIQSATVCMATTDADGDDTCEGAYYSTTT
ncbi:MAG: cadherin repeat domain-containing protein, partial [SAR86 cluster bacterium]|nr:cadherin repeat domain-containing protein [SAR86 cluster bacterium]